MAKFVKVPIERYIQLERHENELLYLHSCGVDNWDSGISISEYEEETGNSMEFTEKDIKHKIVEEN